jgi:hypothetical protein
MHDCLRAILHHLASSNGLICLGTSSLAPLRAESRGQIHGACCCVVSLAMSFTNANVYSAGFYERYAWCTCALLSLQ